MNAIDTTGHAADIAAIAAFCASGERRAMLAAGLNEQRARLERGFAAETAEVSADNAGDEFAALFSQSEAEWIAARLAAIGSYERALAA